MIVGNRAEEHGDRDLTEYNNPSGRNAGAEDEDRDGFGENNATGPFTLG